MRPRLGALIVDTYPDKQVARFAVEQTLREVPVDECLLVSDTCFVGGARHVPIEAFSGIAAYNEIVLDRLAAWADCEAYLLVQWDGFVLDGRRWRGEFLEYDYIGAPWPHLGGAVGGGGFSLRSLRLIRALEGLRRSEPAPDIDTAEDVQICFKYGEALRTSRLHIAGAAIAAAFAFERPAPTAAQGPGTLGFHGVFNFPLVLPEEQILTLFDSMVPRMGRRPAVWYLFLWHAWLRGYEDLGTRALRALGELDGGVWGQVAQACLQQGMSPRWLKGAC